MCQLCPGFVCSDALNQPCGGSENRSEDNMISANAERAAHLSKSLNALGREAPQASAKSLLELADLVPDLIACLDECAVQIGRDKGEIDRLNTRVAALSFELQSLRSGRAPALRPPEIAAPAPTPQADAPAAPSDAPPQPAAPTGPALPAGIALSKRKALSKDILVLSFVLEKDGASQPLSVEAYRTPGKTFLKTRSAFMKEQPAWRSGTDQYGDFFLCYATDLAEDAPDTLINSLSRYCFADLNAS